MCAAVRARRRCGARRARLPAGLVGPGLLRVAGADVLAVGHGLRMGAGCQSRRVAGSAGRLRSEAVDRCWVDRFRSLRWWGAGSSWPRWRRSFAACLPGAGSPERARPEIAPRHRTYHRIVGPSVTRVAAISERMDRHGNFETVPGTPCPATTSQSNTALARNRPAGLLRRNAAARHLRASAHGFMASVKGLIATDSAAVLTDSGERALGHPAVE
jgi:hypothetical protein